MWIHIEAENWKDEFRDKKKRKGRRKCLKKKKYFRFSDKNDWWWWKERTFIDKSLGSKHAFFCAYRVFFVWFAPQLRGAVWKGVFKTYLTMIITFFVFFFFFCEIDEMSILGKMVYVKPFVNSFSYRPIHKCNVYLMCGMWYIFYIRICVLTPSTGSKTGLCSFMTYVLGTEIWSSPKLCRI